MHKWDNYSRDLVIGWSRHMTAHKIVDCWPWPDKPKLRDVQGIINSKFLGAKPSRTVGPEATAGLASGSTDKREG